VLGAPLPYDDVLAVRDRMWELSPALVRYDVTERTSVDVALAGLHVLEAATRGAAVSGAPLRRPITNFYQTDPISRACVFLSLFVWICVDIDLAVQVGDDGAVHACVRARRGLRQRGAGF
jgi:hypothetical protein